MRTKLILFLLPFFFLFFVSVPKTFAAFGTISRSGNTLTVDLNITQHDRQIAEQKAVALDGTQCSTLRVWTIYSYLIDQNDMEWDGGQGGQLYTTPRGGALVGSHTFNYDLSTVADAEGLDLDNAVVYFDILFDRASNVGGCEVENSFYDAGWYNETDYLSLWDVNGDIGDAREPHLPYLNALPHRFSSMSPYGASISDIPNVSISAGSTYTASGVFTDDDSSSWTATVNYGDGTGNQSLSLDPGSFTLNHQYTTAGTYTVLVSITDPDGNVGEEAATITVTTPVSNNAPVINALSGASLVQADTYTESGSFSDADSSSWTGTVDYGDGSGSQSLNISGTNFSLSHQYLATGTYTVTVNLTDDHSNTASTTTSVTVAPRVVTLSPIADTWLKKDYPNQNEGRSIFMRLKETGKNRSLMKFDQSQIAAAIGSSTNYTAKLKVTIVDNSNNWSAAGRPVNVHRLTTDWMEGNGYINGNTPSDAGTGNGATWNCGVDSNIHNTATDCTTAWDMTNNGPFVSTATDTKTIANNQTGVVEFDVTADVQAFMNGTADDGWVIKKADETASGQVQFGTKESASPAQLVINVN